MKISTFNIENLDESSDEYNPTLFKRIPSLRCLLNRIDADILCLQEVHGQELLGHTSNNPKRELSALETVILDTPYVHFHTAYTTTSDEVPYDKRNLVILSRWPIVELNQYKHDHLAKLGYRKSTVLPAEEPKDISWERPILHAQIEVPSVGLVHVINLHLKSRLSSNVKGQKLNNYTWKSAAGWAEGYFLSSIKRVGQALETRVLLDQIFATAPQAKIVVCGDFNAEPGEVPVEAIRGRVENTGNPALRHTVMLPCSLAIADSVRFSHLHHGQKNLLDHMLISQSMFSLFSEAHIFNENLHDESLPFASDSKFPESDHAPFVAHFNS
ncbi:endonuclease/exonuclease/phosphatase family protein [Paraglaciecola aquimarina]|uniref:Endonuclease/exonuclease/phosphatase family protein n=1 Tax=Paraglaciecola aquimarina TaxID=1235557 RepID=A0ABU3SUM0_9ALTE|nr:endonuclease/exonuclease/phosphatase family protein [Paraglaciecola aquimarina]MDU0353716.1 endonuclease/exonuclease/phosphatase family protein [Paraglaciecola aquimarina]